MKTPLTEQEQRELDEIFRWMAAYVNHCNKTLCFWEKHGTHIPNPYLEQPKWFEEMGRRYRAKFDPNQPRVPAGNSDGGRWTLTGGGSGSTRTPTRKPSQTKLPKRKPPFGFGRPMSEAELSRFNEHAPRGTAPADMEIHPGFGVPRWYVDGRVQDTPSPLDLIGFGRKPVTDAILKPIAQQKLIKDIPKMTLKEGHDLVKLFQNRAAGLPVKGLGKNIQKMEKTIYRAMGGKPKVPKGRTGTKGKPIINKDDDAILLRDNIRIRTDIKNPGLKRDNITPEKPHIHIQKFKDGEWVNISKQHRIYIGD